MTKFFPPSISSSTMLNNPRTGFFTATSTSMNFGDIPVWARYQRLELRQLMKLSSSLVPTYTWGPIDTLIAAGLPLGLRIRCIVQGDNDPKAVPDNMPGGWYNDERYGGKVFVPNWNDTAVKNILKNFIAEFGRLYRNKLAFIDCSIYGRWGEFHMWRIQDTAPRASTSTLQEFTTAFAQAFPQGSKARKVMMIGNSDMIRYCHQNYPGQFDIRADSLGKDSFDETMTTDHPSDVRAMLASWPGMNIAEPNNPVDPLSSLIPAQISEFKIQTLSTVNFPTWSSATTSQRNALKAAQVKLGYRYRLSEIEIPSSVTTNTEFPVTWKWVNSGNDHTYDDWKVILRMVNKSTGQKVASWESGVDLRNVSPGTTTFNESLALSYDVPAGTYAISVRVEHPDWEPMYLAQTPRVTGGGYTIGDIVVVKGTAPTPEPPPPGPTPDPTPDPEDPPEEPPPPAVEPTPVLSGELDDVTEAVTAVRERLYLASGLVTDGVQAPMTAVASTIEVVLDGLQEVLVEIENTVNKLRGIIALASPLPASTIDINRSIIDVTRHNGDAQTRLNTIDATVEKIRDRLP